MRTRVGYSGGISKDPTYRSLGDHAETIQIDFDPRRISYAELLEVFCGSHNPCARPPSVRPSSRQYMSGARGFPPKLGGTDCCIVPVTCQ